MKYFADSAFRSTNSQKWSLTSRFCDLKWLFLLALSVVLPAYGADVLIKIDDRAAELESPVAYRQLLKHREENPTSPAFVARTDPAGLVDQFVTLPLIDSGVALFERDNQQSGSDLRSFYGGGISPNAGLANLRLTLTGINGFFSAGGRSYIVNAAESGFSVVYVVDERKRPPQHGPDYEQLVPLLRGKPRPVESGSDMDRKRPLEVARPGMTASIDILVLYTASAVSVAGGVSSLRDGIETSNADLNIALKASSVYATTRIVSISAINLIENVSFKSMLDSAMIDSKIAALKRANSADIVVIMTGRMDLCGLATLKSMQPESAVAIVSANPSCNETYAFAHEVGHILGADHDLSHATQSSAVVPYAHGYVRQSALLSRCVKTIMAYPVECSNSLRFNTPTMRAFSNLTVLFWNEPIGDARSNNARVLNENAWVIASFDGRSSVTAPSTSEASSMAQQSAVIQIILNMFLDN